MIATATTYQKQWGNGKRRKLHLVDLHSMEKKEIHTIKKAFLVEIGFSPDNKYIYMYRRFLQGHTSGKTIFLFI